MAFEFDVFLSYHHSDDKWTRTLKEKLAQAKYRVWLDQDDIRPGDLFANELEKGLANSQAVVLVCSPEALKSRWVLEEYNRALVLMNESDSPRRLIPVLLRDAELPGFLKGRQWVDFRRDEDYESSFRKLLYGLSGQWPEIPPEAGTLELHEIMLTARRSLVISGHTLDKFSHDRNVKAAFGDLVARNVDIKLVFLNPCSAYAKAHEPFHLLESHSAAEIQSHNTIVVLKRAAEMYSQPKLFHVYLTDYMPRFRAILVDGERCYVSLYLYGEDVGAGPEFVLSKGGDATARRWFEAIARSVSRMLDSPTVVPLIASGRFNYAWENCRIARFLENCLHTRCCKDQRNCWHDVRQVVLGCQNENERLAEAYNLIPRSYEPGTFRLGEISASKPLLSSALDFEQWARQVLEDDAKVIAQVSPSLAGRPEWQSAIGNVYQALVFNPPARQEPLKNEIWYQEYSDVLRRLFLTFAAGDPDRELDLYPHLTSHRRDFVLDVLRDLEKRRKPNLLDWLHLSVAAGLLGVDEKPAHAATSAILRGSGIKLDRQNEPREQEICRVADALWEAAKSPCRIDASAVFLLRLESARHDLTLAAFSDDYLETVFLLRYYEALLKEFPRLRIHLIPRSTRCSNDASYEDISILMQECFPALRVNERLQVDPRGPKLGGVNLRKLHPGVLDVLRTCSVVDIRGARNYEMLQGIKKEAYFGFMVCRDFSESVTGLQSEKVPFIYIRHQPGDRSFEGFRDRRPRAEGGKALASLTVADQRDRWQGGHLAEFASWPEHRKEAYRALRSYYVDNATDFDDRFGDVLEPEVRQMLDAFTGRVLVVGCGSGKEVEYLYSRGCDPWGTDSSPEAIRIAERRHEKSENLRHRFALVDLYDIDLVYPPSAYDGIVANAVLVHLLDRRDLKTVLSKFAGRLRRGGLCFVRVLEKEGKLEELDDANEPKPRWFVYFTADEVSGAAREAGFEVLQGPDRRAHSRGYQGVYWIAAVLRRL